MLPPPTTAYRWRDDYDARTIESLDVPNFSFRTLHTPFDTIEYTIFSRPILRGIFLVFFQKSLILNGSNPSSRTSKSHRPSSQDILRTGGFTDHHVKYSKLFVVPLPWMAKWVLRRKRRLKPVRICIDRGPDRAYELPTQARSIPHCACMRTLFPIRTSVKSVKVEVARSVLLLDRTHLSVSLRHIAIHVSSSRAARLQARWGPLATYGLLINSLVVVSMRTVLTML
jgi:hypothetical protein